MTYIEAFDIVDHPAAGRFFHQARESNEDIGQRDAARATLVRMARGETLSPPARLDSPSSEDLALRAYVARHGCCGGSTG